MNKTVVFDFDGVINSYKSGWTAVDDLPDEPVEGIRELIQELRADGYTVIVCSARAGDISGYNAIVAYLKKYDIETDGVTDQKPPAIVYIDDRAIRFDGNTEGLFRQIKRFEPWYERKSYGSVSMVNGHMD